MCWPHLHNLHGHGQLGAPQAGHQLGIVHNAHELLGRQLHHLLTQQSTTAALDHVQVTVNLIGTIDGDVNSGLFVQCSQGNAQALGLLVSADGGGYADDVLQLPLLHQLPDTVHSEGSGGTSAEAHHHVRLYVLHGLVCGLRVRTGAPVRAVRNDKVRSAPAGGGRACCIRK